MRVPPKAYGPSKVTVVRDRRGQCAGFKEDESVLRDRPTLADPRLGESTRDPNRTHQGRPGAPTKPYPYKQDLKPAPDKGEEAQFACEVAPTAFAWIAGACFLVAGLAHLTTTPTTNQFDPLFDVDKYDRPRTSGD